MKNSDHGAPNRRRTGAAAEALAVEYLKQRGYQILATNFRPRMNVWRGEIDIVAADEAIICFIEVKARRSPTADPTESVTVAKRRQIIALAEAYLTTSSADADASCRFDVVSVTLDRDSGARAITLFQNAFWPE